MEEEVVLPRSQRDKIRWRMQYLMTLEKKLLKKHKGDRPLWVSTGLAIIRKQLVKGIKLLLSDFENNKARSKSRRDQNYWLNQLSYYEKKLFITGQTLILTDLAKSVSEDGLEMASTSLDFASTVTDVLTDGRYLHTSMWDKISESADKISSKIKGIGSVISISFQALLLAGDSVELVHDRMSNPDKKFSSKLLQGGRWRRMLKSLLYLALVAVGIVFVANPVGLAIVAGIAAFFSGSIECSHHIYEKQKQRGLDKRLRYERDEKLKSLKELFFSIYGEVENKDLFFSSKIKEISNQTKGNKDVSIPIELRNKITSYRIANMLLDESKNKLLERNKEIAGTVFRTLGGVLAGALLIMGILFPPLLIAGASLSVIMASVEVYSLRDKIKLWPAKIKQAVICIKNKVTSLTAAGVLNQIQCAPHPERPTEEPTEATSLQNKNVTHVLKELENLVITPRSTHNEIVQQVASIQENVAVTLTPEEANQVLVSYQEKGSPVPSSSEPCVSHEAVHSLLYDMLNSLAISCRDRGGEEKEGMHR